MDQYVNTDSIVEFRDVTITQAEKVLINYVPDTGGGIHDVVPDKGNIFQINAGGYAAVKMNAINSTNFGQSGTIILVNGPGGTTWDQLPANMLTPSGANIDFITDPNAVSLISFLILDANKVMCNYIGNFA